MPDSHILFEILVREHAGMLSAYLRSTLGNSPDVDDVFQETLVVAWRRIDDFDRARPFGPWLRGIARNVAAAHRRASLKRPCTAAMLEQIESRLDQISSLNGDTWQEKLEHLAACVEQLPGAYRDAITLRYYKQSAIAQVSDAMRISVDAVKKRLQRGRQLVLECIVRKLAIEER